MIAAEGLSIGHGGAIVGRDLSRSVAPGEFVCLLGPNGCGKTTLFRMLFGLIPPLGGRVLLGGRHLARLGWPEIAKSLASVPQAHVPPFPYAVEDVVLMGRTARIRALAAPSAADREAARAALARLGVADLAGSDYSRLSGGQRQKLAEEAPVLIMDEPTARLDFGNETRLLARIAGLAREGGHAVILSITTPTRPRARRARPSRS